MTSPAASRTVPTRRQRLRDARGTTVAEFALMAPMVIFLFMGVIEFGRYFFTRVTLQHAVREAARYAVTGNTLEDPGTGDPMTRAESIRQVILEQAAELDLDVDQIDIDPANGGGPSEVVRISADFSFEFIAPPMRLLFPGGTQDFTVATVMKNEPFFD